MGDWGGEAGGGGRVSVDNLVGWSLAVGDRERAFGLGGVDLCVGELGGVSESSAHWKWDW